MGKTLAEKWEYQRRYYEANKERLAEGQRRYYEANKERLAEGQRRYREANKERLAEGQRRYREANKMKWAGETVVTRASENQDCARYDECLNRAALRNLRVVPCLNCQEKEGP